MLLRVAFIASFSLALLSACDPRAEEETSLPPAEDLSPPGIIERILEAEQSITSIREDRTDIQQPDLAEPANEPNTTKSIRIQVGDSSYSKYEIPELMDFCQDNAECLDPILGLNETLFYNDGIYYRDRSGSHWVTEPDFGCPEEDPAGGCFAGGSGGFVEMASYSTTMSDCPALDSIGATGPSQIYAFDFSWLTNPEQLATESDGTGLTHIRSTIDQPSWPFGLSPEMEAAYAECGIDTAELYGEEEIPADVRDSTPDRLQGAADLWVDPVTYYVHRIDWSLDMFNGDRLLQSDQTSARYSLFNQAELPGPLPE